MPAVAASAEAFVMQALSSVPASSIPAAIGSAGMVPPEAPDGLSCSATPPTAAVVILSFCQSRILSWMLVKSLSS